MRFCRAVPERSGWPLPSGRMGTSSRCAEALVVPGKAAPLPHQARDQPLQEERGPRASALGRIKSEVWVRCWNMVGHSAFMSMNSRVPAVRLYGAWSQTITIGTAGSNAGTDRTVAEATPAESPSARLCDLGTCGSRGSAGSAGRGSDLGSPPRLSVVGPFRHRGWGAPARHRTSLVSAKAARNTTTMLTVRMCCSALDDSRFGFSGGFGSSGG